MIGAYAEARRSVLLFERALDLEYLIRFGPIVTKMRSSLVVQDICT
jgi:hypothetical protein